MRRLCIITAFAWLFGCSGCTSVCDSTAWYLCIGTVVDQATSQPPADAQVTLRLLRAGESIGLEGPRSRPLDAEGAFAAQFVIDRNGGPCGEFWPAPAAQLGDPPDEIEITVETLNGIGTTRIAIEDANLNLVSSDYGEIELGIIAVQIAEMP